MKTFGLFTLMTLALTVAAAPQAWVRRQSSQEDTCLDSSDIVHAFESDGNPQPDAGEVPSFTSSNNFINLCAGLTLTDGKQETGGSCNSVPMGSLPALDKMPSSKFTNPRNFDTILANQPFPVTMVMRNLAMGTFTNPVNSYFAAPQQLDASGTIVGHSHIAIDKIVSDSEPTDPIDVAFFKGVDGGTDENGEVTIQVEGGVPPGEYRLCSINSSSNHQPVLVGIVEHGPTNDCIYFTAA